MEPEPLTPAQAHERRHRSRLTAIILLGAALLGGTAVTFGYIKLLKDQAKIREETTRLPYQGRLESNLVATERSGRKVSLDSLRGKVLLVGHVYTNCPRGCSGLASVMRDVQETFAGDDRLHFLSFTVNPEIDGPEQLDAFAKTHEIDPANWWFLTDRENPDNIRKYLTTELRFRPVAEIPPAERLNEFDLFEHDMRLALIDHEGHIRYYYDVMDPTHGAAQLDALKSDLRDLLAAAGQGKTSGLAPWVFYAILGLAAAFILGIALAREKRPKPAPASP